MNFNKWLLKKGAVGGAARLFIKAYRKERRINSNLPDKEIFKSIVNWRYDLTGENIKSEELLYIIHSPTPREFVKRFIITERQQDLIGTPPSIIKSLKDVVDEICDEEGLDIEIKKRNTNSDKIIDDIEKYFFGQDNSILKYLKSSKINKFTKLWINLTIISIFDVLEYFISYLRKENLPDLIYIRLLKNPTRRIINVYLKLNIIHLMIMSKDTKGFDTTLKLAGIEYKDFKESIFNFFNFSKELRLIYSDQIFSYKNGLDEGYLSGFYHNLIKYAFRINKGELPIELLIDENMNSEKSLLCDLYQETYNRLFQCLTDYMENLIDEELKE